MGPRRTGVLALVVAAAIAVDVATVPRAPEPLPVFATFDPAAADEVQIARGDEVLIMRRAPTWTLEGQALRPAAVVDLLSPLADIEVVGRASEEVVGWSTVRFTVSSEGEVLTDVVLGPVGATGLTLMRRADSDEVLQVRLPERGRYDASVAKWLDR